MKPEDKKIETTETETQTEQPKNDKLQISPEANQSPGAASIPVAPPEKTTNEVSVKDLTKLNETLTKRIEKLEASQNLSKNEPKPKPKSKENYIPSIQKTEEVKPKNKKIVSGVYVG